MPVFRFDLEDRSPLERTFRISKDARLPDLEVQVRDGDVAVDLTGATVAFSMDDSAGVAKVNAAAGVLVDATDGKVSYQWEAVDVDTEGVFSGQFVITISSKAYRVPQGLNQKLTIAIGPRVN